jgi:hypothetical protein
MGKVSDYDKIINGIKMIVQNNTPELSIMKISKMNDPLTDKKIGLYKAYELYKINIDYSVKYDKKIYANNVSLWNKKILRNLKLAEEAYNNLKN